MYDAPHTIGGLFILVAGGSSCCHHLQNKTWTLEMDVPESAFMPRLVSDPGSRAVKLEQHPLCQRPVEEHIDGALPLHSPVSPSFAMQKLRTGKEGTNIL